VYLAVAYVECLSRPVRAVSDGCGCDDTACEYSRVCDSYRIVVLDDLPSTYAGDPAPPDLYRSFYCPPSAEGEACNCPKCAPCATEPWVILADLTVDGGAVTAIDCDSHRRYVASLGAYYFMCQPQTTVNPDDVRVRLERSLRSDAIKAFDDAGGVGLAPLSRWTGDRLAVEGVEENSALGRRLRTLTIEEIAGQGREAFVDAMVEATSEPRRELVAKQANEIWSKAADVVVTLSTFSRYR
jgi:hypothetical protein